MVMLDGRTETRIQLRREHRVHLADLDGATWTSLCGLAGAIAEIERVDPTDVPVCRTCASRARPAPGSMAARVLDVLRREARPMGPTEIGLALGIDYGGASSRTVPALRRLVQAGLARRLEGGRYEAVRERERASA